MAVEVSVAKATKLEIDKVALGPNGKLPDVKFHQLWVSHELRTRSRSSSKTAQVALMPSRLERWEESH